MYEKVFALVLGGILLGGCATGPRDLSYPAFIQAEDLDGAFHAGLPGTRAKGLSGDPQTGRFSALLLLPEQWRWNTGAAPGKSVEIFVLLGEITLGDLQLRPGNYAYLPPGSTGLSMSTLNGAQVLYFLGDADPNSVIQTPLFMSRDVVPWEPLSADPIDAGLQVKELRADPGSGAKTYLLKIEPGATQPWRQSSVATEGFLLSGEYRHSECVDGKAVTGEYAPGGYFQRPPGIVNGGPEAGSEEGAVWFVRTLARESTTTVDGCPQPGGE
ncbi:MAG: cupin domain-containing protein [Woeseiaceae bacterium]